jgi:hypothetical protein
MENANHQGGTVMATVVPIRRELAHRESNGIEVTLLWSKPTNRVSVVVFDAQFDERFEFDVDARVALDAFYHPYVYAPADVVRRLVPADEPLAA